MLKSWIAKYKLHAAAIGAASILTASFVIQAVTQTITFGIIGDFGIAGANEAAVASMLISHDPDFIVTSGDNNYPDGAASTIDRNIGQYYSNYIYPYKGSYGSTATENKFFPVPGNHDWHAAGLAPYLDYFTLPGNERYYDFVRGPVHFFMLDTDTDEPDGYSRTSKQAQWLQSVMSASTSPFQVVLMHYAPYSSGTVHGSNSTVQWPFELWGADVVIAGHEHTYERLQIGNIPYFVNGIGGASIYSFDTALPQTVFRYNQTHGAMLVTASDTEMTFEFYNKNNSLIDSYTIYADEPTQTQTPSQTQPTVIPPTVSTPVPNAFYVAPNGSDSNPGTIDRPFKTIKKAASIVSAGSTVYIREGVYVEKLYFGASGTASNRIVYQSYPGEVAIIDGNNTLAPNWEPLVRLAGDYITIADIEIRNSLGMCLLLQGRYGVASNIEAHHCMENGILIKGDYGIVENSDVYDAAFGRVISWASCLSAARRPTGAIIRNNHVWDCSGEGISSYEAFGTLIENNLVENGIHSALMYISDTQDVIVRGNTLIEDDGVQYGLLMGDEVADPNTANILIENNYVEGARYNYYWYGGAVDGLHNVTITNNVFVEGRDAGVRINAGNHTDSVFDNNTIIQTNGQPPFLNYGNVPGENTIITSGTPTVIPPTITPGTVTPTSTVIPPTSTATLTPTATYTLVPPTSTPTPPDTQEPVCDTYILRETEHFIVYETICEK